MKVVILPKQLCKIHTSYIKEQKITSGSVFVTKNGKPLDRSNIWKLMKDLCESADVSKNKVFPHNLRHLFARTYYSLKKDIVRLADILGHSSVNTTKIYMMESRGENNTEFKSKDYDFCDAENKNPHNQHYVVKENTIYITILIEYTTKLIDCQ